MAVDKVLARDTEIEINEGTHAAPSWTAIGNKKTITHTPSANESDVTDFESDGDLEHRVVSRGHSFTVTCWRMEDTYDGSRDEGQEAVEALSLAKGVSSVGEFRITTPGAATLIFYGTAKVTELGGGNDDHIEWQAEIKVTGAIARA